MFTQPCFIRNARKELAFNVAALGYVTMYMVFRNNIEGNHLVLEGDTWHFTDSDNHPHCIDCGTNEDLFLAIASLRDDTDKGQWFIYDSMDAVIESFRVYEWLICNEDKIEDMFFYDSLYLNTHKATVQELIEHFSKKEEKP